MELKKAMEILTRYVDEFEYRNKYLLAFNEENLKLAIETVLKELKRLKELEENSIPKKKIENEIKKIKHSKTYYFIGKDFIDSGWEDEDVIDLLKGLKEEENENND